MKYFDIKNQLAQLITFSLQDIYLIDPDFRQATLYDWEKAGKVVKLRNNCYVFNDFVPYNLDYYLLSNRLYAPSYVSMELALNHYGIIPEGVSVITAVSTNKTQSFISPFGEFQYQSIKPELFFGYDLAQHRNHRVQIASLEKAVLDYLYLHSEICLIADFESLRWNQVELTARLNNDKFAKYLTVFDNQSLENRVATMRSFLRK